MASGKGGASLIEKRVEEQVLRALQEKEAALDAALQQQQQQQQQQEGDPDDELERLRQQRRRQMQQRMQNLQEGYGAITELHDEKDFFQLAKKCPLLVLLFYRSSFALHESLWALWQTAASKHLLLRVAAINAEKAPFLTDRLKIWCLPTAVLVKEGQTEHSIVGLDEIGEFWASAAAGTTCGCPGAPDCSNTAATAAVASAATAASTAAAAATAATAAAAVVRVVCGLGESFSLSALEDVLRKHRMLPPE
ncbi:hypothetical protein Efla_000556 [Eimeria flavescens]